MEIADHKFLVTGGGSGLGAATARGLVNAGAKVLVADLNKETGERIAAELGDAAIFVETDVTDEQSAHAAIDAAVNGLGGLHGVVNCAGIVIGEKVLGRNGPHELGSFARAIQVNLVGTFNVIRLAAAVMKWNEPEGGPKGSGERGVIVNTASVAAFEGQIGQAAYSASKGGIVSMTLPVARELAVYGIRVMTIAPGIFDTPMMAGLPEEARESLGKQVPFPSRLGRPEEYAALARHVVENEMLNGEVIRLDGAIRMTPR